jgi:hypothetical protein
MVCDEVARIAIETDAFLTGIPNTIDKTTLNLHHYESLKQAGLQSIHLFVRCLALKPSIVASLAAMTCEKRKMNLHSWNQRLRLVRSMSFGYSLLTIAIYLDKAFCVQRLYSCEADL